VASKRLGPSADVRAFLVDVSESGMDAHVGPPALTILGSRGAAARSLKRLVLGSTCEYVVKAAAAPLCVVPPLADVAPTIPPV
jgi:nucleotide-binding universal stress UspA family protein